MLLFLIQIGIPEWLNPPYPAGCHVLHYLRLNLLASRQAHKVHAHDNEQKLSQYKSVPETARP